MSFAITERAAEEIKRVQEENKDTFGAETFLRVGIAAGGCSGFSYKLGFDKEFDSAKDNRYEVNGVSYVVDKKSELLLDGASLDFVDAIDRRGFAFNNPNAVKSCGCGSSFQA